MRKDLEEMLDKLRLLTTATTHPIADDRYVQGAIDLATAIIKDIEKMLARK